MMPEINEAEKIRNDFIAILAREINEHKALIKELTSALKEAKAIIRIWHNVDTPPEASEIQWRVYNNCSPEMKRLNSVIEKGEANVRL